MKNNLNPFHDHFMVFLVGALVAGDLVYLSDIRTFLTHFSDFSYFSETLDGLSPGTYFSTIGIFLIFIIFLFGGKIFCVTLFDETYREDFRETLFYDPDREDFG